MNWGKFACEGKARKFAVHIFYFIFPAVCEWWSVFQDPLSVFPRSGILSRRRLLEGIWDLTPSRSCCDISAKMRYLLSLRYLWGTASTLSRVTRSFFSATICVLWMYIRDKYLQTETNAGSTDKEIHVGEKFTTYWFCLLEHCQCVLPHSPGDFSVTNSLFSSSKIWDTI